MNIIKTVLIFISTLTLPCLGVFLLTGGIVRMSLLVVLLTIWLAVFWYSDKLILLFLGAREVADADSQDLFQSIKSHAYRNHEKLPKVYLYTGHRVKSFVIEKFGSWSIVLDRSLIKNLDKEQTEALVAYIIEYKKKGYGKIQTIGMGVLAIILRFTYWFWDHISFDRESKFHKLGIFISLIIIKPLVELILCLSKTNKRIEGTFPLKSIFMQVDRDIINRPFTEFMVYHLDSKFVLSSLIVEFLEEYPMLENCSFEELT